MPNTPLFHRRGVQLGTAAIALGLGYAWLFHSPAGTFGTGCLFGVYGLGGCLLGVLPDLTLTGFGCRLHDFKSEYTLLLAVAFNWFMVYTHLTAVGKEDGQLFPAAALGALLQDTRMWQVHGVAALIQIQYIRGQVASD